MTRIFHYFCFQNATLPSCLFSWRNITPYFSFKTQQSSFCLFPEFIACSWNSKIIICKNNIHDSRREGAPPFTKSLRAPFLPIRSSDRSSTQTADQVKRAAPSVYQPPFPQIPTLCRRIHVSFICFHHLIYGEDHAWFKDGTPIFVVSCWGIVNISRPLPNLRWSEETYFAQKIVESVFAQGIPLTRSNKLNSLLTWK